MSIPPEGALAPPARHPLAFALSGRGGFAALAASGSGTWEALLPNPPGEGPLELNSTGVVCEDSANAGISDVTL